MPKARAHERQSPAPVDADSGGLSLRTRLVPSLVVVVAGALVYANSFSGVFLFDDIQSIVDNPHIRTLWPLTSAMTAPPQSSLAGRPIASLTLALNYAVGGLDVRGYHAFNLIVHLLAGLLLYGIVRRTLSCERLRAHYGRHAHLPAMIIAALWVIHPLQTESVTYVIQRTESLAGCFYLLTLYGAIRGGTSHRPLLWHIVAVVSCGLGMATKETVITAPLLVLLHDRIFLSGSFGEALRRRKLWYAGLAATWGILAAILAGGPRSASAGFGLDYLSPRQYALTQVEVVLHYLKLCFWPYRLCLDYHWPPAETTAQIVPAGLALAALLGATIWALFRRPALGFLGAWFFLILSPTSSFVPIMDPTFEHRMYLPLAAVVALVVLVGYELLNRLAARGLLPSRLPQAAIGSAALIGAGLLGYRTYDRNRTYQSGIAMWSDVLVTNPDNPRAHNNLANYLIRAERVEEAVEHGREALRLNRDYSDSRNNLGIAIEMIANQLADRGRHQEAVGQYREALQFKPDNAEAHNNCGTSLRALGEVDQAIEEYRAALRIKPLYANAMINLGNALWQQGRQDEAIEQYRAAISAEPHNPNAHLMLGTAYLEQKMLDEAIEEYHAALHVQPNLPHAHYCLGLALERKGRTAEAVESYRRALAINPNHTQAQRALDAAMKTRE